MNAEPAQFSNVKFVFLDRDGVINRKAIEGEYIGSWAQFSILPGVESAIRALNEAGKTVAVVTNQRGIALGRYTEEDLGRIHSQLQEHLEGQGAHIDAFYFCPHDKNQCDCRKPKTALLERAFREVPGSNSETSILIGDSLSDIQAAKNMGMRSIFIEGEPDRRKPGADKAAELADAVTTSLQEAVKMIL